MCGKKTHLPATRNLISLRMARLMTAHVSKKSKVQVKWRK